MAHPLLHLLITQPGLLAEHAAGYAEMFSQELGVASGALRKRVMLAALGLSCAVLALVFAGVALMLWATGLTGSAAQPWVLWVTPLVPAVGACACCAAWRAQGRKPAFENMVAQLRTDAALLRQGAGT